MKFFGPTEELTATTKLIMEEDIDALEKLVDQGFDINKKFQMAKHTTETPLELALCENKYKVLEWLLSHNVELNDKEDPAIVMASSNCNPEIIKLLLEKGADIHAKNRVGKTAMSAALSWKKHENVSFLLKSGYDLHKDGTSLRQAVSSKQKQVVEIFLAHGIDVNFCEPDMVYPYNSTPAHVAAENNDMEMLKLLVEHGADVTVKNRYGVRPYTCAVNNRNTEMQNFIKSLEPEAWHSEEQKLKELKRYKIPEKLMAIIRSENRRLDFPQNTNVKHIIFNSVTELQKVTWKNHIFIDLLREVDNYCNEGFLVWYPKTKRLAFADYEHEVFKELCGIRDFLADPEKQISKIFE